MTINDKAMLYDYLTEQIFAWASENYLQYTKDLWTAGFDEDSLIEELVDNCKKTPEEARILVDRALAKDKHTDELTKKLTLIWSDSAGSFVNVSTMTRVEDDTDNSEPYLFDSEKEIILDALERETQRLEHLGEYECTKEYYDLIKKVKEEM